MSCAVTEPAVGAPAGTITLPDGSERSSRSGVTGAEIAAAIGPAWPRRRW